MAEKIGIVGPVMGITKTPANLRTVFRVRLGERVSRGPQLGSRLPPCDPRERVRQGGPYSNIL